jgi:hypothetical protein
MSESLLKNKLSTLMEYGISESQAAKLIIGSIYYQDNGGIDVASYWHDSTNFNIRDEFYLIANTYLAFVYLLKKQDVENIDPWLGELQVAYLYYHKLNAQSIKSVDHLLSLNCFADAFAICRTLQSRVNMFLLCSLSPELFDHWTINPNDQRYREGEIRKELTSLGINTMEHVYKLASEVIHGHFSAHSNIGFFVKGLFADIPAIRHQIYTILKFLLAAHTYAFIQALLIGLKANDDLKYVIDLDLLFKYFFSNILEPSRIDHFFAIMGEERHWKKIGDEKYDTGGVYSFDKIKEQIIRFHNGRDSKSKLSKKYQLCNND